MSNQESPNIQEQKRVPSARESGIERSKYRKPATAATVHVGAVRRSSSCNAEPVSMQRIGKTSQYVPNCPTHKSKSESSANHFSMRDDFDE